MQSSSKKNGRKETILNDHRRVGKRFIPPFVHHLGGPEANALFNPGWFDRIFPELIFFALLNRRHGLQEGAALSLKLATAAGKLLSDEQRAPFFEISAFGRISSDDRTKLKKSLESDKILEDINTALSPLYAFYPESPLGFLTESQDSYRNDEKAMAEWKDLLDMTLSRWGVEGTWMQANAVYVGIKTGFLHFMNGTETLLNEFDEISNFPDNDASRKVAAGIRAASNALFLPGLRPTSTWPGYFWRRGRELEKCKYD